MILDTLKYVAGGLALGLVLFACDAGEQANRNAEEFARARASREIRRITEVQIMDMAMEQGRALRDGVVFELPRLTARPASQLFFGYGETPWTTTLPEKLSLVLDLYADQYEQGVPAQENLQVIDSAFYYYSFPTDSGVHLIQYTRSELALTIQ